MREIRLSGSVGGGPQEGGCLPNNMVACDRGCVWVFALLFDTDGVASDDVVEATAVRPGAIWELGDDVHSRSNHRMCAKSL